MGLEKIWRPRSNRDDETPQQSPTPTPSQDVEAIEREIERLEQVEKELRTQLDNGRAHAAREIAEGRTPNPHGLGREINETIPAEIRAVQQQIRNLRSQL